MGQLTQPNWLQHPHMRVATCVRVCTHLYRDPPSPPAFPLPHPKLDSVGRIDSSLPHGWPVWAAYVDLT